MGVRKRLRVLLAVKIGIVVIFSLRLDDPLGAQCQVVNRLAAIRWRRANPAGMSKTFGNLVKVLSDVRVKLGNLGEVQRLVK